ncbi:MAG TPA: hypothetical protein VGR26_07270, partial [Acidimicrobiales bacterium]|nr:hypothetical protein [Acidimicrobiales bacterium]
MTAGSITLDLTDWHSGTKDQLDHDAGVHASASTLRGHPTRPDVPVSRALASAVRKPASLRWSTDPRFALASTTRAWNSGGSRKGET